MARHALVWMLPPLTVLALAACQEDPPKEQDPGSDEPAAEDSGSPEPCETWYLDEDGDGYGDPATAFESCDPPEDAVQQAGDSDDSDSSAFPGATELCDGVQSDSADTEWADDAGRATFFPDAGEPQPIEGDDALVIDVPGELRLCAGEFGLVVEVVADDVRIVGAGATESALVGRADSRVVTADGVEDLAVSGLTLRAGDPTDCADGGTSCGGGLALFVSSVSLTDVHVSDSTAARGGGVFVGNGSVLTAAGGELEGNQATQGGGLYLTRNAEAHLTGALVARNDASESGGGLRSETALLSLTDTELYRNTAEIGGGLFTATSGLSLDGVRVSSNEASSGGGIAVSGGSLTLENARIISNRGAWGAGINVGGGGELVVVDSTIDQNVANLHGGGIYAVDSTAILERATLTANRARDLSGGGVWSHDSPLTVTDSTLEDNRATSRGGGIGFEHGSGQPNLLSMTGSTVTGNNASSGGGISFVPEEDWLVFAAGAEITTSTVSGNEALTAGGGIYVSSGVSLALSEVAFSENEGADGGGMYLDFASSSSLVDCEFLGNAGDFGGGLSMRHGTTTTVDGGRFEGNTATGGGGAIRLITSSEFTGAGMDFVDNTPDDVQVDDIHGAFSDSYTLGLDASFSL